MFSKWIAGGALLFAAWMPASASAEMMMSGMLGSYPMQREASGTSWQPDSGPHSGLHLMRGGWILMLHGMAHGVYDHQGGKPGDSKLFCSNMVMLMGRRELGPGRFGFRTMLTAEPITIGKDGYPLLLQTGETANGRTQLIDRQHPHDLFMELALSYSLPVTENGAIFTYIGFPGEPALGPPAFMHRFSGIENPEAPITHHWLDSTHITFGVATIGGVLGGSKLEASAFNGREPDQNRFDIESPNFDSYAFRASQNLGENWSLQASYGRLFSPEQLHPFHDTDRYTASAIYNRRWRSGIWQSTLAWGRNRDLPGRTLDAWLLESTAALGEAHHIFGRAERVLKDELLPENRPNHHDAFLVGKLSLGYTYDVYRGQHLRGGIGALGSLGFVPRSLEAEYGKTPRSWMLFARLKLV